MKKNGKDSRPGLPPIRKIEVSEEQKGLRIALAAVFLAIGAVAIIIGLVSLLNTEPGWQEVQINANGANCAGEFVLMYDFSDAGSSASAVNKRLTSLYSQTRRTPTGCSAPMSGRKDWRTWGISTGM